MAGRTVNGSKSTTLVSSGFRDGSRYISLIFLNKGAQQTSTFISMPRIHYASRGCFFLWKPPQVIDFHDLSFGVI